MFQDFAVGRMNPCRGTGKEYNPCPSQVVKRELAACDPFPVSKLKPRDGDLYHESYPRVIQSNLIPRSSFSNSAKSFFL